MFSISLGTAVIPRRYRSCTRELHLRLFRSHGNRWGATDLASTMSTLIGFYWTILSMYEISLQKKACVQFKLTTSKMSFIAAYIRITSSLYHLEKSLYCNIDAISINNDLLSHCDRTVKYYHRVEIRLPQWDFIQERTELKPSFILKIKLLESILLLINLSKKR